MLVEAAAVFISLAAMFTLQIASGGLLFLGQVSTVTGSTHLWLALVGALERRQGRAVHHSAAAQRGARGHGYTMRQAAGCRAIIQCHQSGLGHGAPPVDSGRSICHGTLHRRAVNRGLPSGREGRTLTAIDAVRRVYGTQRGSVGVGAIIRGAGGQTRGIGTDGQSMLTGGTRRHGMYLREWIVSGLLVLC